jgi:creatinine amidohydrolase
MRAAELTWSEYERCVRDRVVVVPIGSIEPHGPHLPLGTDNLVAEHLADRLAEAVPAIVLPTVSYGYKTNPARLGGEFPGTVDIKAATLRALVLDILQATYRDGARRFMLLHGAYVNIPVVYDAMEAFIAGAPDARVMAGAWWDFTSEGTRNRIADETGVARADDNHAAMVETSLVMHMAPGVTRTEALTDDGCARRTRYAVLPMPADFQTKSGVVYRASRATSEIGARVTDEIVSAMVAAVRLELTDRREGQ